ncbi:MAG: GGDEF domain-containing protein [Thiomonas sp.]
MPLQHRGSESADANSDDGLPPADDSGHPIGKLGLFRRAEDEHAYVLSAWPDITSRLRLLGLAGGGVFVLASVVDWTKLHDSPQFWSILLARLVVLALGIHLWWVARLGARERPDVLRRALIAFQIGGIVAFRLVNLAYGDYSPNQGMSGLLMVLAFYAFVPMLSPVNYWLLPLSTATLFLMAVGWFHATPRDLTAMLVIAVFVHLLGWSAAVRSARSGRLAWLERLRLAQEMEERRAAESNLRHLFEVCPVPLVLSDRVDGKVLRFNRSAQALLDPQRLYPDPGSAHASRFYAETQSRQAIRDALDARGEVGPVDVRMLTAHGANIHVMLAARSLRYDGKQAVLTSLVEITERKQRELALARQTQTDMLTGLYNRRGFFEHAEPTLREARGDLPSLLLIDADHFKRVNDTHGHAVGDAVLLQLASRMSAALREGDVIGRIGGEEFAVFLPATHTRAATALAERMRELVARHALRIHGLRVPMTLSIGVTRLQPGENTLDAALSRADAAMYQAKQRGRNRVEVAAVSAP